MIILFPRKTGNIGHSSLGVPKLDYYFSVFHTFSHSKCKKYYRRQSIKQGNVWAYSNMWENLVKYGPISIQLFGHAYISVFQLLFLLESWKWVQSWSDTTRNRIIASLLDQWLLSQYQINKVTISSRLTSHRSKSSFLFEDGHKKTSPSCSSCGHLRNCMLLL